ncbi:MAG: GAF domain-containing protein, partial [Scytonema sp. CRU_2_7]|nr:GAF domain-containing protein [Scytonema sp. CRU_2_7]
AMQVGFALDNAKVLAEASGLRLQVDIETEWTHYFTDTIGLIRQSLKEEDILKACVQEVRRVLVCERVVIYSLDINSQGIVIAESVTPGYPRALGVTIKDPCFEAKYIEKYQNGRVRALDNIYEANLTPCYIEQLEKLAVQANLVAPILNEGKLLGLLVAHQCSKARQWQQHEIRWFSQIAMQVGFALENAKLSEQNNLAYQIIESLSQQYSQQEEFQQQVVELLKDSEISFKTFSTKALNLSESLAATFNHIQEIADAARSVAATATQAEFQVHLNYQTLQEGQETVKQTLQSVSDLQEGVTGGTEKVKQLGQYCQKLSNLMDFVSDLTNQMNCQDINIAIAVSQSEIGGQESVIANTDKVRTLRRQLLEAIGEIQNLLSSIIIGANEVVRTLEAGTQQILTGTQSLQTIQQKLYHIATVSSQMSKLVEKITQRAANQTQTSHSASQYVISASNLVHQTLEQSQTFSESFNQLATAAQEVTQKNGFWDNIRRSLLSSRTIMTFLTPKK